MWSLSEGLACWVVGFGDEFGWKVLRGGIVKFGSEGYIRVLLIYSLGFRRSRSPSEPNYQKSV